MAQEKIIIKFEPKGDKNLMRAINLLTAAQKGLEKGTRAYKAELKRLGLQQDKYVKATFGGVRGNRIFANSFATLRSALLLFQFAMGMGIKQLIDFTKEAGKLEGLQNGFNELTKSASFTTDTLQRLRSATNDTASDMDLLKQANNALILGVAKNSFEMEEMFDVAQRLGKAVGVDTKMAIESLVTGLGRQSRLMLDNIGIIVKSEQAYDEFAQRLGTTADKLTNTQKKTAFLEAGLKAARDKVKSLGDEVLTTGDRMAVMQSQVNNLKVVLGKQLAPIIGDAAQFWSEYFGAIEAGEDKQVKLPEHIKILQRELDSLNRIIDARVQLQGDDNRVMQQAIENNLSFAEMQALIQSRLGLTREQARLLNDEIQKQTNIYTELLSLSERVAEWHHKASSIDVPIHRDEVEDLGEKYINLANSVSQFQINVDIAKPSILELLEVYAEQGNFAVNTMNAMSSAMAGAAINGKHMGEAVVNALRAIAIQLTSKMAVYRLLSSLFPGAGLATGAGAAFQFAFGVGHKGGLITDDGKVQRFAGGGTIRGGDNVPILAQGGEFVMQRSAVESIGIENLNRMNQGGGGAITVNVSGNVLSQDFVEGELAENIKEAIRRGTDFGIS